MSTHKKKPMTTELKRPESLQGAGTKLQLRGTSGHTSRPKFEGMLKRIDLLSHTTTTVTSAESTRPQMSSVLTAIRSGQDTKRRKS